MGIFTSKWEDIVCKCGKPAKVYDMWCNCSCHEEEVRKRERSELIKNIPYYKDIKESKRIINKIRHNLTKDN